MAQSRLFLHYGLLHMINNTNVQFEASQFLSLYDEFVLQPPGAGAIGSKTKDADTYSFLEIVKEAGKGVYVYIPMTDGGSFANAAAALTAIQAEMDTFNTWFTDYGIGSSLKGFFIDEFGFDFQYADLNYVSRADQNNVVTYAHTTRTKPVFVNAWYVSDVFTKIGPSYGGEEGNTLADAIFGSNSSYTDRLLIESPLSGSIKADASTTWNDTRMAYVVQALKTYQELLTMGIAAIQIFDLTNATFDGRLGLSIPAAMKTRITDYANFMASCGITTFGGSDTAYGASSNKALHKYLFDLTKDVEPLDLADIYSDDDVTTVRSSDKGIFTYGDHYTMSSFKLWDS
jgi:hypothetical protein